MSNPYIKAVCSLKGGVGKTTTSLAEALEMANSGLKVGIIGLDVTPGLATWLSPFLDEQERRDDEVQPARSSWRLIMQPELRTTGLWRAIPLNFDAKGPRGGALYNENLLTKHSTGRGWTMKGRLDFIPDSEALVGVETTLAQRQLTDPPPSEHVLAPEDRLAHALEGDDHDVIILDLPPARTTFLLPNALRAADGVVIPLDFSALSQKAYARFDRTSLAPENKARARLHLPPLPILGVVMVRYDPNGESHDDHEQVLAAYREIKMPLFTTVIPEDPWIGKATFRGIPPQYLRIISPANQVYPRLTREVMDRAGIRL